MQKIHIQLPLGDLIDAWEFTRLIAKTLHPDLRKAKDVECVREKIVAVRGYDFSQREELTIDDRAQLAALLPHLPPLSAEMTDAEKETFHRAYDLHPDRPAWKPRLLTTAEIQSNPFALSKIQERHLRQLALEVSNGTIQAYDAQRVAVVQMGNGTFISREHALSYLAVHHFCVNRPDDVASRPNLNRRSNTPRRKSLPISESAASNAAPSPPIGSGMTQSASQKKIDFELPAENQVAPHAPAQVKVGELPANRHLSILKRKEVEIRTSLSRSAIYDRLDVKSPRHDPTFPRQVKLGKSSIGFVESEIDEWLRAQTKKRK